MLFDTVNGAVVSSVLGKMNFQRVVPKLLLLFRLMILLLKFSPSLYKLLLFPYGLMLYVPDVGDSTMRNLNLLPPLPKSSMCTLLVPS